MFYHLVTASEIPSEILPSSSYPTHSPLSLAQIENYVPGKLDELRLGYKDCKELNPSIIYASITGYGQTGPYRNNPGYDVMIEVSPSTP